MPIIRPKNDDKSTWGSGPWLDEPNLLKFTHLGYHCEVRRMPGLGHLCGYVTVPAGHPWHGKSYDELADVEVHGGLTYAELEGDNEATNDDRAWELGFDCAHLGDISPGTASKLRELGAPQPWDSGSSYKTVAFVQRECRNLATQAAEVENQEAHR